MSFCTDTNVKAYSRYLAGAEEDVILHVHTCESILTLKAGAEEDVILHGHNCEGILTIISRC